MQSKCMCLSIGYEFILISMYKATTCGVWPQCYRRDAVGFHIRPKTCVHSPNGGTTFNTVEGVFTANQFKPQNNKINIQIKLQKTLPFNVDRPCDSWCLHINSYDNKKQFINNKKRIYTCDWLRYGGKYVGCTGSDVMSDGQTVEWADRSLFSQYHSIQSPHPVSLSAPRHIRFKFWRSLKSWVPKTRLYNVTYASADWTIMWYLTGSVQLLVPIVPPNNDLHRWQSVWWWGLVEVSPTFDRSSCFSATGKASIP